MPATAIQPSTRARRRGPSFGPLGGYALAALLSILAWSAAGALLHALLT